MKTKIGGDRLGSGSKLEVSMRNYERSTHDLGYTWRSTMAAGTLVPFLSELALPGDSWDIGLECDMKTHPTIGPLFGSYKVQLDVFQVPIRLYNGKLHMNMLGIGMKMSDIKLPQLRMTAEVPERTKVLDLDNAQINPSCILSYLGMRGLGTSEIESPQTELMVREFNAIPYLAYWDIYKNYYANKQEEEGAVIHNNLQINQVDVNQFRYFGNNITFNLVESNAGAGTTQDMPITANTYLRMTFALYLTFEPETVYLWVDGVLVQAMTIFQSYEYNASQQYGYFTNPNEEFIGTTLVNSGLYKFIQEFQNLDEVSPKVYRFPLENIDTMRTNILTWTEQASAYTIEDTTLAPYGLPLQSADNGQEGTAYSKNSTQEGLGLKTYQSDLFNNWISTEWIDGDNGVNALTAIDTTSGSITIDEINMSRKIYDMLNRIALSGGSYDDWLDATYSHDRVRSTENPVYMGGLSKELVFQEVIANSASEEEPLGTLAGRGVLSGKHKGGDIRIRVDEPSYIIGIISLTPRLDYSQGNKWDVNLKTLDDLHKPALDEIGFQDLITDQMAWWDTTISPINGEVKFRSAGKQPAWINYMTNVDQVRGNFANQTQQMFMVLNRRYEANNTQTQLYTIKDLTTYIDPTKFNHIFADTRIDAQNFWAQIAIDATVRRKMSAKIMPNL